MASAYGYPKGEIVDKLFYINNTAANGITLTATQYRVATDFVNANNEPLSDHFPIVVDFTVTNPNEGPVAGAEYYIRNKATGKFINQGADWGVQAVLETYGNRMKIETVDNGVRLKTTAGYMKNPLYLDGSESEAATFTLADGPDGTTIISIGGKNLAANGTLVDKADPDPSSTAQQWEFLSLDDLTAELGYASESNPKDATFFIKGANFSRNDTDNDAWNPWKQSDNVNGMTLGGPNSNFNAEFYNPKIDRSGNTKWSIEQQLSNIPNGKYKLTCQAFYRDGDENGTTNHTQLRAGDISKPFYLIWEQAQDEKVFDAKDWQADKTTTSGKYVPNSQSGAAAYFAKGLYTIELDVTVSNNSLSIKAEKNESTNASSWSVIDNFRLTYYGPTAEQRVAYDRVKAALDHAAEIVATFDNDGKAAYNNRLVEQAYAKRRVSVDGVEEVKITYEALAAAAKAQTTPGADMTPAIMNWSFELRWMHQNDDARLAPWWANTWPADNSGGPDVAVRPNSESKYHCSNTDGDYLFNTWCGDNEKGYYNGPIAQTITGLPNGTYRVKGLVTSHAGHKGYVFANGQLSPEIVSENRDEFKETSVEVTINDGKLTLGAVGEGLNGATPVLPVKHADEMWDGTNASGEAWNSFFYKADKFRLEFLYSNAFNYVQVAINDATAKATEAGLDIDLSEYQTKVDNHQVIGDGNDDVISIYNTLAEAAKAQTAPGSNMTGAIINNSFEFEKVGVYSLYGWNVYLGGDTGVKPNSNDTYHVDNADGDYVFNTYDSKNGTEGNWGAELTQEITGLPLGIYRLEALLTSWQDHQVVLTANGEETTVTMTNNDHRTFLPTSVEFLSTDGKATIGAKGIDSWYKADNFQLTLVTPFNKVETNLSLVTMPQQMVPNGKFYIAAEHSTGHHTLGNADDTGVRALVDEEKKISHIVDARAFILVKDENGYSLTPYTEASPDAVSLMAVTDNSLKVNFSEKEEKATITDSTGNPLGFHPAEKNFGFTADHSIPAGLYTAAYDATLTGVDDVLAGSEADGEAVYYNLQGVRVDNPGPGLYIKKQGSKAVKVIVK